MSPQLRDSAAALNDTERIDLIAYIEGTLIGEFAPSEGQQALVARRIAEMAADPSKSVPLDEHLAAVRALIE